MYEIEIGSQLLQIYGDQLFQQIHNQVPQRFVAGLFVKEFIAPGYRKAAGGVSSDRVFKIRRTYRFLAGGVISQQQASAELVVTSNDYLLVQYAELEIGIIQAGGTNLCVSLYAKKAALKPARLFMLLVLTTSSCVESPAYISVASPACSLSHRLQTLAQISGSKSPAPCKLLSSKSPCATADAHFYSSLSLLIVAALKYSAQGNTVNNIAHSPYSLHDPPGWQDLVSGMLSRAQSPRGTAPQGLLQAAGPKEVFSPASVVNWR